MLSEKKFLLHLAELAAIAASAGALHLAAETWRHPNADFPVLLWGGAGIGALMLTFLPACMLGGEYIKTVRMPETWRARTAGLSTKEVSAVIYWAPAWYKAAAILGVLLAVGTALKYGSIEFRSNEPVNPHQIPGMFLYLSAFFLLALPVLGSAARMPGSYAANSAA